MNKDTHTPKPATQPEIIELLKDAWLANQVTFTRSINFEHPNGNNIAPLGEIFYLIDYRTETQIVYEGAYKMSTNYEAKLIAEDKLNAFLIHQLSKELV